LISPFERPIAVVLKGFRLYYTTKPALIISIQLSSTPFHQNRTKGNPKFNQNREDKTLQLANFNELYIGRVLWTSTTFGGEDISYLTQEKTTVRKGDCKTIK
jgi:hypothetical protein